MTAKSEQRVLLEQITPGRKFRAVTPSDALDLPDGPCKALWVGTAGDLVVIGADDTAAVTLKAVPVGLLQISAKQIKATSTTATDLVALY